MRRQGRAWVGTEVATPIPVGQVRLELEIEVDVAGLDASTVVGVFLYRDDRSELDFEFSAWGESDSERGQFVVAPPTRPSRIHRFAVPPGTRCMRLRLDWRSESIRYRVVGDDGAWTEQWTYRGGGRPRPRGHRLHVNVWRMAGTDPWHERAADASVRILNVSEID